MEPFDTIIEEFMEQMHKHVNMHLIKSIYLRGSVARGDATEHSDVDISIIWHDELISEANIVPFVHQLKTVIAKLKNKYVKHFSVPKVMSYKVWKTNMHATFVEYGQDFYYHGKILYGEDLRQEVHHYQPERKVFAVQLYRNILLRISSYMYQIYYHAWLDQERKVERKFFLKHYYNILRMYAQLASGKFCISNEEAFAVAKRYLHKDWILGRVLPEVCEYIPNTTFNLTQLVEQLELLHLNALEIVKHDFTLQKRLEIRHLSPSSTKKLLWECDHLEGIREIGSRIQTNYFAKDKTKLLIGSRVLRQSYYDYYSPDELIIRNARAGQKVTMVDPKILELHLLKDWSHISYNWVNKLLECRINNTSHQDKYKFDYLRLLLLRDEHKFHESEDGLAEFVEPNLTRLMVGFRAGIPQGLPELVVFYYRLEQELFLSKLLPAFASPENYLSVSR